MESSGCIGYVAWSCSSELGVGVNVVRKDSRFYPYPFATSLYQCGVSPGQDAISWFSMFAAVLSKASQVLS